MTFVDIEKGNYILLHMERKPVILTNDKNQNLTFRISWKLRSPTNEKKLSVINNRQDSWTEETAAWTGSVHLTSGVHDVSLSQWFNTSIADAVTCKAEIYTFHAEPLKLYLNFIQVKHGTQMRTLFNVILKKKNYKVCYPFLVGYYLIVYSLSHTPSFCHVREVTLTVFICAPGLGCIKRP